MTTPETRIQNRKALIFLFIGLAIILILMSLPLYSFTVSIYTKKSSNTFVGDEKYKTVRAEVEAIAEEYQSQGFDIEITEDILERINSKGETTSLITFSVNQRLSKNIWSFLKSGFSTKWLILIIIVCLTLSPLFALLGTINSIEVLPRYLDPQSKKLRSMSGVFALIALLLVPVFVLANNVIFSRKASLYTANLLEEGKDTFYYQMDRFLFNSQMEDKITQALNGLNIHISGLIWLLIPAILLCLISVVQLRHGEFKSTLLRGCMYIFVVVVCLITLYPYYVMTITAFRSNIESLDINFLHMLPTKWIWTNLTDIIHRGVPQYLFNSLVIAGGATILAMLCGIPAAYAMARMNFIGKRAFLGFVIMSQMFSPVVLLIGISQLMNTIHLNNSLLGLMLINAAFNQAFAIWLLRGTFVSISSEMEQAALIDGCDTVGALTRVLIPMAAPGIVTTLIYVFINAWNEYTISTVLISNAAYRPITVGITTFSSFNMIEWQYLFAASLLATIPVVILFLCIEKHLVSGLTSGGVKG